VKKRPKDRHAGLTVIHICFCIDVGAKGARQGRKDAKSAKAETKFSGLSFGPLAGGFIRDGIRCSSWRSWRLGALGVTFLPSAAEIILPFQRSNWRY
jgi:hypothetical protein